MRYFLVFLAFCVTLPCPAYARRVDLIFDGRCQAGDDCVPVSGTNPSTGTPQTWLVPKGDPSLDIKDGVPHYVVPTENLTPIVAPNPASAAAGDAIPKPGWVSTDGELAIPIPGLTQLADGTWSNEGQDPSPALAAAWAAAGAAGGVPTPNNVPLNSVMDVKMAQYVYGAGNSGTVHAKTTSAFTTASAGCIDTTNLVSGEYYEYGGKIRYNTNLGAIDGCSANFPKVMSSWATYTTVPSTTPTNFPPPATPTPEAFQQQLLDNYGKTGDPDSPDKIGDYNNVCSHGGCSSSGGATDDEISQVLAGNGSSTGGAISGGITGGDATGRTDGSQTGAMDKINAQIAGLQKSLGDIQNDLEKPKIPGEFGVAGDIPEINWEPLSDALHDFSSRWPFSLANDITQFVDDLASPPQAPRLEFGTWFPPPNDTIVFDFDYLSPYASTMRGMMVVLFNIGLIFLMIRIWSGGLK